MKISVGQTNKKKTQWNTSLIDWSGKRMSGNKNKVGELEHSVSKKAKNKLWTEHTKPLGHD
jgi:hypothetical protein